MLDEGHAFGPIVDIMDVVHNEKKRQNARYAREIAHLQRNTERESNQR